MTREHVFSEWVKKVLEENPQWRSNKAYIRGNKGGPETHVKGDILDSTVRIVCDECNGGWMGNIEKNALPYVGPMIKGEQIRLDRNAQHAVATWAALKAVVARYSHSPTLPPIEAEWMEWLRTEHTIPKSWHVWLGAYRGDWHGAASEGFNIHDRYSMMPPFLSFNREQLEETITRRDYKGVLATFIIGYLAIKVFGVRRLRIVNARRKLFVTVAPSKRRVYWPPKVVIGMPTMIDFFEMGLQPGASGIAGRRAR